MPKKNTPSATSGTQKTKDQPALTPEEQIIPSEYSELMQKSYIDYAMSVIIARALPDIRDGLKPVQRRTLYDMEELGIHYNGAYRKSARIVGDTMGKYHPHGDSSIYDSLVVMAQDFKKTMPLVDGHGNFGTIEGDSQAAMRYTEARLQKITEEAMLADLDKNVVDFVPNFDETEREPSVLPCMIPNFLINGSEGIAVGMATSTPTHNAAEAINAELAYLDDPDLSTRELMRYLPGPDFPTGGVIINRNDLEEIYETGAGKIRIRGKMTQEKGRNGHINLVVTEIPYTMIGSGIAKFLQDVAALSENRLTNDIIDISNQSNKEGIRIVIELRKDADVENFKALLLKKTRLLDTFGVNMLAIRDGRPETLGLRDILKANVDFAFEVTRRKYETLLAKEKEKREIQEGLIKAVNVIDLIIEILRGSRSRDQAKQCLVKGETKGIRFKSKASAAMAAQLLFTEPQAEAILNMRLYKLIGLELDALVAEHEKTVANIYEYEDILENRSSMTNVIRKALTTFRDEYQQPRRTQILEEEVQEFQQKTQETEVVFLMDRFGYAKTISVDTFEKNKDSMESDYKYAFPCKNTGRICIFSNLGNMYTVKVSDLPAAKLKDKGLPIDNVSDFDEAKENIVFIISQSSLDHCRLLFVTKQGLVKTVAGGEFDVTRKTIAATNLTEGDELVFVAALPGEGNVKPGMDVAVSGQTTAQREPSAARHKQAATQSQPAIVLQSKNGYFLKFPLSEIAEQKKNARGVRGMKLSPGDEIENVYLLDPAGLAGNDGDLSEGSGKPSRSAIIHYHDKEIDLSRLKLAGRDGKGTKH